MATISDVAKRAGVSIATVSYVLNGKVKLVREETADRIRRVAEEMNYSASPVARGLATGSSYTVAVVLPDHAVFSHPIGSQEFLGVAEEFYMSNYSMLIKPSYSDQRKMKHPHTSIPRHVAGVLILGPMNESSPDLAEALKLNKPTVVAEDLPDQLGATKVNADNRGAARLVTEHLIAQGHTSIGIIAQTNVSACMNRRIEGYKDALAAAGLEPNAALVMDLETRDESEITQAAYELIDSPLKPTAIVALNSAMMPALSLAIKSRDIRVPERMAVGCVDYAMPSNFRASWPIVTLKVDLRYQGELAARALIEMLGSKNGAGQSRLIAPELIILEP